MPKFVCTGCNKEYWGWGAYHNFKKGDHFICPECDGHLLDVKEAYTKAPATGVVMRTSAA